MSALRDEVFKMARRLSAEAERHGRDEAKAHGWISDEAAAHIDAHRECARQLSGLAARLDKQKQEGKR